MKNQFLKAYFLAFAVVVLSAFFLGGFPSATLAFFSDNFTDGVNDTILPNYGSYYAYYSGATTKITNDFDCYTGNCARIYHNSLYADYFEQTGTDIMPRFGSIRIFTDDFTTTGLELHFYNYESGGGVGGKFALNIFSDLTSNIVLDLSGATTTLFADLATSTWYKIAWEYSQATDMIRFNLDTTSWTTWYDLQFTQADPIDNIKFFPNQPISGKMLIDNIFYGDQEEMNTITIYSPQNGDIIPDFSLWVIEYSSNPASSSYSAVIQYGQSTSSIMFTDTDFLQSTDYLARQTFQKEHALTDGDWYAQPFLYVGDDLVGYGGQIALHIDHLSTNTPTNYPEFEGTWSDFNYLEGNVCAGIATSTIMGDLECIFRKTMAWAFYPSANSLLKVKTAYEKLQNEFPFSVYYDITGAITDAVATTTTTTTDTFKIPMITSTGTIYMLPVLSSSSLPNLIGGTNANIFRNTLSWLLWIATAFLIFVILF